ncbi:protein phosphatase 2C domain-containing protein [Thermococcus sp.]|uniref:PP2C family protein-serine/threonine phosphatase n=1 Tax=Thermococcus sp. TaxID=35749 RepID=UPI00262D610C|nr:protein phosphatase 2C domain-containing protein [Thermococcus sp.]
MKATCTPNLCVLTHIGARMNNEDDYAFLKLTDAHHIAVADGMGGHAAGEVASRIATQTASAFILDNYETGMDWLNLKFLLRLSHELAHSNVIENAAGERRGMGTTLISAIVRGNEVFIANTGDSRAALIREGKTVARTVDHSLVQELVNRGEITEEEAFGHPASRYITSVVGGRKPLRVDLYRWMARPGDALVMSTDGLHDYVPWREIEEISKTGNAAEIAFKLLERALEVTRDNVTIAVWKW